MVQKPVKENPDEIIEKLETAANGKPIPTIHGALYVWHYKVRRWLRRKLGWFWWLYLAIFVFLIIKVLRK